uniref:NADH-ubiquinone oxidoreductase chain 2 n=1 Tax=Allopsontus sp. 2 JZ-2014 TaxID=1529457 RepID=A0A0B4N5X5_9INSE|nr:NADH dehydrogenase subunit 2 [Allopsontus sp. 2 JZ-2014]
MNPANLLFLSILIGSTLMSVSSTSWFGAWMGLEINLLSFIPILSNDMNQRSSEASLKYFLTQALGSIILISGATTLLYFPEYLINPLGNMSLLLIGSALLLKMGAAPFHFWFPAVMEGLSWINSIILMTWQKLGPLVLLSYNINKINLLVFLAIITSAIFGSLGGLNQTLMRKVLAFSSISHMAWMMTAMGWKEHLWLLYYLFYITLTLSVALILANFNISHMNQTHQILHNSKPLKLMLSLTFLSLGGLPPLSGFIPKWMVIQELLLNKMYLITFVLVMTALITLFFYTRVIYVSLISTSTIEMWNNITSPLTKNINLLLTSSLSLLLFPSLLMITPVF